MKQDTAMLPKTKYEHTIKIKPSPIKRSLLAILRREPTLEQDKEHTLVFEPCKVGNMIRIANRALQLPNEWISGTLSQAVLPVINDSTNLEDLLYIIAAGVQNNYLEPDRKLVDFLRVNLDHEDLFACLHYTMESLGMQSFLNSIILLKGTAKILDPDA